MKKFLRYIYRFFLISVFFGLCGTFAVVGFLIYLSFELPEFKSIKDYQPAIPSQILSSDGTVLLEVGRERRYVAKYDEIPRVVIDAILSAEDDNFFNHEGIEYLGIMRALIENIKAGRVVQGGSTITQQVAKSLLRDKSRSIIRKMKDFMLAKKIEEKLTKEEILFIYFNQVYLGGGFYGIKAAFKGYFEKELSEATIAESAMLAGLLVAPGKYSPYVNPIYAKKRQGYVLKRMYETRSISEEQFREALVEPLRFKTNTRPEIKAGHFTDWIRQRVLKALGTENFLTEGFKVVTTIDWDLQQVAEKEILEGVKAIDKRQGYKGPINSLGTQDEFRAFLEKERREILREASTYFLLNPDGTKEYEYKFDEFEFSQAVNYQSTREIGEKKDVFFAGIHNNDNFPSMIKVGENYRALVIGVSDEQRAVYVSIGGVRGIIPYEGFSWAKAREITEDKYNYSLLTRPSEALKVGDVILVKVEHGPKEVWPLTHIKFRQDSGNRKYKKLLTTEKFVVCQLDQDPEVQAGLVSIHPENGEIVAMVGGSSFQKSQFNRVIQSLRQPGSSFKPLLFAAGLESGYTASDIIIDSPESLAGVDETLNWKPRNYDGKFKGPITFRRVLEESRNVPSVKIAESIGLDKIIKFSKRIGLGADIQPNFSSALGSFGVTLLDLTHVYSIFPSSGKKIELRSIHSIFNRKGEKVDITQIEADIRETAEEPVVQKEPEEEEIETFEAQVAGTKSLEEDIKNSYIDNLGPGQVYDPRLAYIMTNILKGVTQSPWGTGRRAKSVSPFIGGKTGTTNRFVDAWFIGFSANLVTGVWTGFDENRTLGYGESGSKAALPIWKGFMKSALAKFGERDFKIPAGIINVLIDRESGRLALGSDSKSFMEAYVEGTEPGRREENLTETEVDFTADPENILEEDEYYSSQN